MVKERNVAFVVILSLITFGIYMIYWLVSTSLELKDLKQDVPTPWILVLLLVPIVNIVVVIYYMWKYSKAAENATKGALNQPLAFVLLILLGFVGAGYVQSELNKLK
ncbi:DUF4234 domain-containing protein [Nanoarchaeota archaeon]